MRKTRRWAGLSIALNALVLGACFAPEAGAEAMPGDSLAKLMNYSTVGTIDSEGVVGNPVIGFNSVSSDAFTAPSAFSLGEFQVAGLPDGSSTSYTDTPFSITYLVNKVDGSVPSINQSPITIKGVLNGSVSSSSQSDVVATFDPASIAAFQTGSYLNTLKIKDNALSLVPSSTNSGRTTAQARIIVQSVTPPPVPEPTSIAIFLTAIVGLCLRRRLARPAA